PGADPVFGAGGDADRGRSALPEAHVRGGDAGGVRRGVHHGGRAGRGCGHHARRPDDAARAAQRTDRSAGAVLQPPARGAAPALEHCGGPAARAAAGGEPREQAVPQGPISGTQVAYAGVCITEGGLDVDAAITLDDLTTLLERRNVRIDQQEPYFSRLPEERRRHWSTAGGLPLELLREESHASKRFRKVRGLGALEGIARAVAVDRIELGFVDILPCEGCLDHPLLGPRDELFRRREIVGATEPTRSLQPVVDDAVAQGVQVGESFPVLVPGRRPGAE